MDVPCCFNTFSSAGVSFQTHPISFCPSPAPPSCSTSRSFPHLVAVSMGPRGGDGNADGGALSTTQLMFRNMAALLYRSVPRMPKAERAGSSSRFPPPDSDSESESEGEEGGVSEEKAEELEYCLEEEAMAGIRNGREPEDYDRRAQLFDEGPRVFQALKEREEGHHRRDEGS